MRVRLQGMIRFTAAGLVALTAAVGSHLPAQARYRYPPRLPFDHRPALSPRTVGALSLDVLAAGADEAMESEFLDDLPPIAYPPPPGYDVCPY